MAIPERLTVIIPYRDHPEGVRRLLASLPDGQPVIVVDDCSDPPLRLRRKGVKVIRLEQRGYFAGAVNAGIAACDTDVLVCNQDIEFVGDGWLAALEKLRGDYAVTGDGVAGHPAWPKGYVQGTLLFMRRDAINTVGPLSEQDWPLWGGTAEWQLRACRAGYKAYPIPQCDWFTHERGKRQYGSSIAKLLEEQPENRGLFIRTPPLISVVTACHNYGRFLGDWLSSLIGGMTVLGQHEGQTFQGFEAVICDDASTDDSWAQAQALADPWQGVRAVRRRRNGGTAAAMNTAIRHSYGRYIMVLDADDMLEPLALETMLREIEANPHSVVYTAQRRVVDGKRADVKAMRPYDFGKLLERNLIPAGMMFSRQAWKEAGGFPEAFAHGRQDWAMAVALGAKGYCGRPIQEPLYLYRRHGGNRTLRNTTPSHWREFASQMRATFPDLYRGERPMGCCGGRGSRAVAAARSNGGLAAQALAMTPGADVLMEYVGPNTGRQTLRGPVTRTPYTWKGARRQFYVDARDVEDLLDYVDDHMQIFRIISQRPVDQPVPEEVLELA